MKILRNSIPVLATVLVLGLTGCNVFRGQSTPGQYVDDVAITTKVKAELVDAKKVDAIDVNVDSKNGAVKLTGWASNLAEKSRAGSLAAKVEGVKSVDNQIQIKK